MFSVVMIMIRSKAVLIRMLSGQDQTEFGITVLSKQVIAGDKMQKVFVHHHFSSS